MKYEKSAGAVVFRENSQGLKGFDPFQGSNPIRREYLLLARKGRSKDLDKTKEKLVWDFPKGLVEGDSSERATAEREVAEETGLSEFSFVDGFRETIRVLYKWEGEFHTKTIIFFLARTTAADVKISFEHVGFEWLSFEAALKRLSFKNSKEILKKAEDFLNGQFRSLQQKLVV